MVTMGKITVRPTGKARLMPRGPQRTIAVGVRPVRVSPGNEDQLEHFRGAAQGGYVQWRGARSPTAFG